MKGLRERQKASRRQKILSVAELLFKIKGYENTTIENIAEEACVGVATVYNYYGSKSKILLELVAKSDQEVYESCRHLIVSGCSENPVENTYKVLKNFNSKSLEILDRKTWKQVVASNILEGCNQEDKNIDSLNQDFETQIGNLIKLYKDSKSLPSDYDEKLIANILTSLNHELFVKMVKKEDMAFEEYCKILYEQISFIFRDAK